MLAGECLTYDVAVTNLREEGASVEGKVSVNGETTVEADIFFAFLDRSRSAQLFGERNFVFSGELKYLVDRMLAGLRSSEGEREASTP
jgi:hypothetical protein